MARTHFAFKLVLVQRRGSRRRSAGGDADAIRGDDLPREISALYISIPNLRRRREVFITATLLFLTLDGAVGRSSREKNVLLFLLFGGCEVVFYPKSFLSRQLQSGWH